MFTRFISLLVLVAPLVSALTLDTPMNVNSGGVVTITWTAVATDPSFSLELINVVFNSQFAIANNVDPSAGSITVEFPIVSARDDYTIEAVNISNINQIYAQTNTFSIGATVTSSGSASSTASVTGTSTNTLASTAISLPATSPSSVSGLSSSIGSGTTGTGTGTVAGTVTGISASTTPSSAAAVSSRLALTNACGYAVLLLSAVAGAAAVAL